MRRLMVFLISALIVLGLCSCELSYQAPAEGKMRILVYGNSYQYGSKIYNSSGELMPSSTAAVLTKTVNDANQVGRAFSALAEKAGMEYEVRYLTELSDVTDTRLVEELQAIAAASSEKDVTVFYYSGHGLGVNKKLDYGSDTSVLSYIVPRYSEHPDSSVLFPVSDLLSYIDAIRGIKVVIGDFCYSGSLVQSNYFSVTSGEYNFMQPVTLFAEYRSDIREDSSLFCLSASRYFEKSYERVPLHGNFTQALLNALGWDEEHQVLTEAEAVKDGMITLSELYRYVTAHDGESGQTPMLSGGSNDIILFSF